MAAKSAPPPTATTRTSGQSTQGAANPPRAVPPPPKPKSAGHWLDSLNDVKVGQPEQSERPKIPSFPAPRDTRGGQDRGQRGPGGYREDRGPGGYREREREREGGHRGPGRYREGERRTPGGYRVGGGMGLPDTIEQRPRQPITGPGRGPRPERPGGPGEQRPERRQGGRPSAQKEKAPRPKKPPAPPKPKREKIPPPQPFQPTPEQVAQVEARYLELAVPTEFDGIRTQISKELGIPKSAVKKIVKALRERENIPSWWELQPYQGSAEELEKIKELYLPNLPLPPIGVHRQIAEQLSLKPATVYQAIKAIRQEMGLPQYNDPALHGLEPRPSQREEAEATETVEVPTTSQEQTEAAMSPESQVPAQTNEAEQKQEQPSSIETAERETDMTFEKSGDTTEIVAATTSDTNTENPGQS